MTSDAYFSANLMCYFCPHVAIFFSHFMSVITIIIVIIAPMNVSLEASSCKMNPSVFSEVLSCFVGSFLLYISAEC